MKFYIDVSYYREFACEILFEQDIDGRSIPTLILDTLIRVCLDFRLQK